MTSDATGETVTRRRLKWLILLSVWAVLLIGLAVWSAFNGPTTVREQTSIASARITIDQAVARVAEALPDGWRVSDSGYTDGRCELSVAHDGVMTVRRLELNGPVEDAAQVLAAVAAGVGDASLLPGTQRPTAFFADAGNYVAVRGTVTDAGQLDIVLRSGCRTR